jgi:hypothetical protein
MRSRLLFGSAAIVLAAGIALAAQAPQAPEQKAQKEQKDAAGTVTVSGCIQKEADVLKKAPMANAAMGDNFVLTHATSADKPTPDTPPSAAVGTTGSADLGKVYRLAGDKEKDLQPNIGKRVEITGTFKHDTNAKPEQPASANTPEITIASIRVLEGSCSGGGSPR